LSAAEQKRRARIGQAVYEYIGDQDDIDRVWDIIELKSQFREVPMQVWIGFKQNDAYVHEWTGEVAKEGDVGQAIGNAIADYRKKSGKAIWGMSIMVDKARPLSGSHP
jgi:hypothetical protein